MVDYIDVGSIRFKSVENHGGLYLLAPEFMFQNGCVKVGIANKLGHRISFYRSAYGFWTKIFIFGLIKIDDKKEMRTIEKEIFKKFKDIRVPFFPLKGKGSDRMSEWLIIDIGVIKRAFMEYKKKGFDVITSFEKLNNAPIPNLGIKIMKKMPRGKYLVEFQDGTTATMENAILKKTVNMPPLKDTLPSWLKWITQEEADKVLSDIVHTKTRVEINREGGLFVMYENILRQLVETRQREARQERFKKRQAQ